MSKYDYYFLTDPDKKGTLVRQNKQNMVEYFYDFDANTWQNFSGLLSNYITPEAKYFGEYELVDEQEAIIYISRKIFMKFYDFGFTNK